ncbi:transmembrane protein 234 homolog [Diorhabda carinulata]|uniref:transmembrane protein 234 homolog n=1 Tax=Diorhabda sublineata TaxID=1163346 RepID=UPI0024E15350|nr:transmembrane protein 234 homolog [Diorhabda sublineata]XP_057654271.1 transmembrane protein 234 homolog [Diorhabda carinulata]
MFIQISSLVITGLLWGWTNPLIKKKSEGIVKIQASSRIAQFILELKFLATNFEYLFPLLLNQIGSVMFYFTINIADLTLAVPVANSLAFVFTAVSGWFHQGELPNLGTCLGAICVIIGSALCCIGKM